MASASAPPPAERAPDPVRGTNQSGMRAGNERLILSLLRRRGPLAKSEIARLTGLSAQTVSVMMRALEEGGLLVRDAPKRGKVGQPSVPMRLDPEGAFFFGLKVGRRSVDLVLTDAMGTIRDRAGIAHPFPTPEVTVDFAVSSIAAITARLDPRARARIGGMGIAIPFQLWDWADALGVAPEAMIAWRDRDVAAEIAAATGLAVEIRNDASAACGAELVFGTGPRPPNFVYFYIAYFIGGGVVIDGALHVGPSGNAGALGSMPIPCADGQTRQLIRIASLATLERRLAAAGKPSDPLWGAPVDWSFAAPQIDAWIADAGRSIAYAIAGAAAVLDVEAAMIDGHLPGPVRAAIVDACRTGLAGHDFSGVTHPEVLEGHIGADARALGAASLPLSARYL